MSKKIGYARVSTSEQNLDMQLDALNKIGCNEIFTDKISGKSCENRIGLQECLECLNDGDFLIIYKLDRLARSLKDLISIVESLKARNIGVISINDNIDTSTIQGTLFFQIFGAFAEFERNLICERTRAGLDAARSRGKLGGRPIKMTTSKIDTARTLLKSGMSPSLVARQLGISRSTLYNHLNSSSLMSIS